MSFEFIAAYAVLIAFASVIEVPIGRGFGSVQLNLLIQLGSLAVAILALMIVQGISVPSDHSLWPGLARGWARKSGPSRGQHVMRKRAPGQA